MTALEDRFAVEALLTAYCAAIDRRDDVAGTVGYFTENGVLDNTALGSPIVTGRAALIETITGMFTSMARLEHFLSNFLVTQSSRTRVHAQCYVQAHGTPVGGDAFSMRGIYHVDAQRDADEWNIARLTFQPFA